MSGDNRGTSDERHATRHEPVQEHFDWTETDPSTAIVQLVAGAAGTTPTALGPLYHEVDTDAIDALIRSGASDPDRQPVSVELTVAGHDVCVEGTGSVTVRSADRPAGP